MFAVVQEHVPRRNARIAAWGLLYADDRVDVTTYTEGQGVRHRFDDIDRVERRFSGPASISARLVWVGEPPA
ncbi:hypothetical protein ACOBQX_09705 [Actinokineospora sp. G85]|uniref:hypothetical protein n=1 Tax=Actinokineospora sp. G85 TaxID=3406626 RepID=UPI003C75FCF2